MSDQRLAKEQEFSKMIAQAHQGEMWYWEKPAGKVRLERRRKLFQENINSKMRVLELGCGCGHITEAIAKTGAKIVSIDLSPELLEFARKRVPQDNVDFMVENAYDLHFENESFDAVIGNSILHHLEIKVALKEIYRVLKPGGVIFFMEPNMLNPQMYIQLHVPYLRKLTEHSDDETAFYPFEMKKLLKDAGFKDIYVKPFDFLHTMLPAPLIPFVSTVGNIVERIPLISEIGGSMIVKAKK
jgi:ubiquinone/menaquinone biosynthesis C-methylase UbiE